MKKKPGVNQSKIKTGIEILFVIIQSKYQSITFEGLKDAPNTVKVGPFFDLSHCKMIEILPIQRKALIDQSFLSLMLLFRFFYRDTLKPIILHEIYGSRVI